MSAIAEKSPLRKGRLSVLCAVAVVSSQTRLALHGRDRAVADHQLWQALHMLKLELNAMLEGVSKAMGGVRLKETALVRLLGLQKIPMLFLVAPQVLRIDDDGCELKIPLRYLTRNHLGSMYVGVLAVGADLASGLNALFAIRRAHPRVVPVFKEMRAEFLKRADGDVHFVCSQGRAIVEAVARADETGERITLPVEITALVPSKYDSQPVARFSMVLSLKRRD